MGLGFKIKRLKHYYRGFIRLHKTEGLQGEELSPLLVSALPAAQEMAYLDSYTTGLDREKLEKHVRYFWEIRDREALIEILKNLLDRNHNENMEAVYGAYDQLDFADYLKFRLKEDIMENVKKYIDYLDKLKEVVPDLIEQNIFEDYHEMVRTQDSGWNLARGAFLARCGYDLGYLKKEEVRRLTEDFYRALKVHCKTWKEYTASYILGRTLEDRPHNEVVITLANRLLTDHRSPLKDREVI